MSKKLYEEALADAKSLTAVAEDNAKRAVLEAVVPRIRQLIEKQLLEDFGTDDEDAEFIDQESTMPPPSVPVTVAADQTAGTADAISLPDAEGKVTLDLDALGACETGTPGTPVPPPMFGEELPLPVPSEEEYVLGLESLTSLAPIVNTNKKFGFALEKLAESIRQLKAVKLTLRETVGYNKQITRTISRVENMYEYVQERVTNPAKKKVLEERLENYFKELTKLQELKMSTKKLRDLIKEDDAQLDLGGDDAPAEDSFDDEGSAGGNELTLKLSGLPDGVDLDNVGVDLVGSEDEAGDDDVDFGDDDGGGDEGGDDDLGDLDLGGDTGEQMESVRLSDDTMVEIDENMLRREIARMRKLRESGPAAGDATPPSSDGEGVAANEFDNFGGGSSDGEAFVDGEVTTESEEMDEGDELDEGDDVPVIEMQNRRKSDDNNVSANSDLRGTALEGLKRKIAAEKQLQERAKAKGAALKKAAKKNPSKKKALQKEYADIAARYHASVARAEKFTGQLTEAVKKLKESRSNSGSAARGNTADSGIRKQLAEQNLLNVKLVYANKLLQNETLTKRQKAQIIEQLDSATTSREAKLVYESLVKTITGSTTKSLKEGRDARVLGSSSRVMRSGASQQNLNEGFETDRWATLAGITKKA